MNNQKIIRIIKEKLERQGYDGLYYAKYGVTCGCQCSDLAPCGKVHRDDNGYINDCLPGYKHVDPRPENPGAGDFAIFEKKEPPTIEEWESFDYN